MTYCCGILVRDGLVMIADTRTNAGLDNVSTFRKLHVFGVPGQRIMALASSGNLSVSQSVVSTLIEGIDYDVDHQVDTHRLRTWGQDERLRSVLGEIERIDPEAG